jgi:hypothetical protein
MHLRAVVVGTVLTAAPLLGQSGNLDPQCGSATVSQRATQDACQKAIDTFQYLAPQLGIAITGGSATLGQGIAFGKLGKFSVGMRANLLPGRVPRVDLVSPSPLGATQTTYQVDDRVLGLPTVDAALGVFPGIRMGPGGLNVLAVDALANLAYIPDVAQSNVTITAPDGSLKLGFGGRVGVIQESGLTPGLGVSFLRRDLPRVDVVAQVNDDQLAVRSIDVESQAWRVMLQKSLKPITFVLGAGRDRYNTAATAEVEVSVAGNVFRSSDISASQRLDRDNVFADIAVNLSVVRLAAEVGYVRGGAIDPYNQFGSSRADQSHSYGSLGIRLSF